MNANITTGTTPKGVGFTATPIASRVIQGTLVESDPSKGPVLYSVVTDDGQDFEYAGNVKSLALAGRDLTDAIAFVVDVAPIAGHTKGKF